MITPKQLQQRFAYMFEGGNIGMSIPKGWMPEFAKLCEQIDELLGDDKDGFHWRQCKEKFGSARWYWTIKGERKQALQIDIISGMQAVSTALKSSKPAQPLRSVQDQIGELIGKARVQAWEALYRSVTKDSEVPLEVGEQSQDRPFAALVPDAKAVTQVTGSFSLTWPATGQRDQPFTTGCLLEVHFLKVDSHFNMIDSLGRIFLRKATGHCQIAT